jgi:hypothetical protein
MKLLWLSLILAFNAFGKVNFSKRELEQIEYYLSTQHSLELYQQSVAKDGSERIKMVLNLMLEEERRLVQEEHKALRSWPDEKWLWWKYTQLLEEDK